ncbi:MAG: succinate dehydrogenase assembly factor 2 [Pseudomonadota bacterium]
MSEHSRLRWLCRRGMKELDVVLSSYLEHAYDCASMTEQERFRQVLDMPDPDLYALVLGRTESDDPKMQAFIERLRGIRGSIA